MMTHKIFSCLTQITTRSDHPQQSDCAKKPSRVLGGQYKRSTAVQQSRPAHDRRSNQTNLLVPTLFMTRTVRPNIKKNHLLTVTANEWSQSVFIIKLDKIPLKQPDKYTPTTHSNIIIIINIPLFFVGGQQVTSLFLEYFIADLYKQIKNICLQS